MTHDSQNMEWPGGPEALWEALARHLAGESPAGEAEAVRAWLSARPERAQMLWTLESGLDRIGLAATESYVAGEARPAGSPGDGALAGSSPAGDVDVEAALRAVHARMGDPVVLPFTPRPAARPEPHPRSWRITVLAAAAAVVLLVGGVLVWQQFRGTTGAAAVYAAAVGRTDTIGLADGSTVVLGPASRLSVPATFGRKERQVALDGLAYFEVHHDAAMPFTVRAGGAVIRDVGTAFVVRSDAADGLSVVVTAGSVDVAAPVVADTPVVLRAGQRAVFRQGRITRSPVGRDDADLSWTRGRLTFDDASLDRVRTELHRWYGVDLRLGDASLAGRHVTASFAGEPVQQVVDVIALALGARAEWRGTTVVLHAEPAGAGP